MIKQGLSVRAKASHYYRIALFVAATILLVFLYPHTGKFKYDYQRGKPWMHELLLAPFDFPIYKNEQQINEEKDSLLYNYRPYFIYMPHIANKQLQLFVDYFDHAWDSYITNNFKSNTEDLNIQKEKLYKIISDNLLNIYKKGVLLSTDYYPFPWPEKKAYEIFLADPEEKKYVLTDAFSQKQAYTYLIQAINNYYVTQNILIPKDFIRNLNLNRFIVPNVEYDEATSQKVLQSIEDQISITKGMIEADQKIINRGELVTDEKYQVLLSLEREYQIKIARSEIYIIFGQAIYVAACMLMLFLFLHNFRRDILLHNRKTTFIVFIVVLICVIDILLIRNNKANAHVLPLALTPIIIRTFFDSRLALFIHLITIFLIGFTVPNAYEFIFLNFSAGVVAIFTLADSYRRSKLATAAIVVFATYSLIFTGISITQEGQLASVNYKNILWFAINSLLLLTSYPLIFLFEKLFDFVSDATLVELSDTNQPLLRLLAETAPGTFQHSLVVANLGEDAVRQIGGNPLLMRVGALYHDIGKIERPRFFIENFIHQKNPHDEMEFDKSAEIIIQHVSFGVEIAKKYQLPDAIIDFIRMHHGTMTVQYFYKSYLKKYPQASTDIQRFSYPGPRPTTKETALLMMADAVEAASRSLTGINEEAISDLVDKIVDNLVENNQFDDSSITFKDISTTKEIFKTKLRSIYHSRVQYPA